MHRFEYRNPRFTVDLPAQFCTVDEPLAGRCTDIGIRGMRLDLVGNVDPGCMGTVVLHYQNQAIELKARVARVGDMHCGLEFVWDSLTAQSCVTHLVAKLTAHRPRQALALVPRADGSLGGPIVQR
jgi:PilZ domain